MKKQILSGLLTAAVLTGSVSAAFSDVNSDKLNQTVSALSSLKIMQGDGGSTFSPQRSITRAEFSKLIVTMLGITDVTAYKNYTVFPDVPNTHWAAGYINAAVKHPEIQKKNIIKGYADGTFKPNNTINYGEACTMLLLSLGYTVEDIGPMWPNDYIAKAESLDLNPQDKALYANSVMSREDTAYMLMNTLSAECKEEGDKLINSLVSGFDSEGAILVATSETDEDLKKNQAKFYLDGTVITKNTEEMLDESLIGTCGTLYYSKKNKDKVIAVLPETDTGIEYYTVDSVKSDKIETEDGTTIKPKNETYIYADGEAKKFGENWFDILPNDKITVHYDKSGDISLIQINESKKTENTFVYGENAVRAIPDGYKIIKNGLEISKASVKKYDVISINDSEKTVNVSDRKITGAYTDAKPAFKNPSEITVLGNKFKISEKLKSSFGSFAEGDKITLLLDDRDNVAGVYSANEVRAEMLGIFEKTNGTDAQVRLINGITVKGSLEDEEDRVLVGNLVTAAQNQKGRLLVAKTSAGKKTGTWDIAAGKLGSTPVSPNVLVLEQIYDNGFLNPPLYVSDTKNLPFNEVKSSDIKQTVSDSSGNITAIVIGDISGDGWNYGLYYPVESGKDGYSYKFKFYDYEDKTEKSFYCNPIGTDGNYIGLPKGTESDEENGYYGIRNSIKLIEIGKASLSDFDSDKGVGTAGGYYKIADEVQVYAQKTNRFITLNEAKANYTSFTLYAERTADKGGKIRIITVS